MTPRIYTTAEARALREAAPAGPYEACHPDDLPGRSIVSGGREYRPPYDMFVVGIEDRVRVPLAELFAASPDLAATVEAQAAEIATLRERAEVAEREAAALRDAAREYLDARHKGLVALDAYLDADPADAAARDAVSADEARVTAARTRLAALVGGAP